MSDTENSPASSIEKKFDGFALDALSVLASRLRREQVQMNPLFAEKFMAASTDPDRTKLHEITDEMLRSGVAEAEIVARYIPEAARFLGHEWHEDRMDFATVTIGSARLQGILRELGPEWSGEGLSTAGNAPLCIVTVPQGEQHTLGATLLAGQMRQHGIAVCVELDASPHHIRTCVSKQSVYGVMISASQSASLDHLRTFVKNIRKGDGNVPIVLGGTILGQNIDLKKAIGVDHVTSDWEEALRTCNLKTILKSSAARVQGS